MDPHRLFRRRPSAAMVTAVVALFVAMGGAGYAAIGVPRNSVGSQQLKSGSVTNHKIKNGSVGNFKLAFNAVGARKIINGAVGRNQIDANSVQARVSGVCTSGALTSVGSGGTVTCAAAPGANIMTSDPTGIPVGTSATTVDTATLPGGESYLVTTNPYVVVAPITGSSVTLEVDCTLTVGSSPTSMQTRSVIYQAGANTHADTLSLSVAAPSTPSTSSATVACTEKVDSGSQTPKVSVLTSINALQVAGATTEPYAG